MSFKQLLISLATLLTVAVFYAFPSHGALVRAAYKLVSALISQLSVSII